MNSSFTTEVETTSALGDDTKSVIIQTAMRLFAKHGLEGVSLSELRSASGQNNRSAIHYHFGNKDGLLDAITNRLSAVLDKPMQDSVAEGWRLAQAGELTLDAFIRVLSRPFLQLYFSGELGRDCIRLLSHLSHETAERQRARAFTPVQTYMGHMVQLLQTLMPDASEQELAPLLFLSTCSINEALICSGMLKRKHVLGDTPIEAPDDDAFIGMVLAFAKGGLLAASGRQMLSPR